MGSPVNAVLKVLLVLQEFGTNGNLTLVDFSFSR